MKIARVTRTDSGILQLDPVFVPPLLDIAANDYLMSILRRLLEILIAKSATLSGMRRQKSQGLADFSASDVANFWLLYTVNTFLPQMRHLFEVRRGHPASRPGQLHPTDFDDLLPARRQLELARGQSQQRLIAVTASPVVRRCRLGRPP